MKSEFIELERRISSFPSQILQIYKEVAKSAMLINCWHANEYESEAMWKIYSDSGKGIAIKTTIEALKSALEECIEDVEVNIGVIKYLDYFDLKLSPQDCVVDQHVMSPLIKRKSYEHEHELRLWISRNVIKISDDEKNKPRKIGINPDRLIEKVIISPLATEPFIFSVKEICNKYGIGNKVEKSDLLDVEKLFLLAERGMT